MSQFEFSGWLLPLLAQLAPPDLLRDLRHHLVQKCQAVSIAGQAEFIGVRNAALMFVRDNHVRRVSAHGGTDHVGLVVADTNDPSVLVEIKVPDPAADMAAQIDPTLLHARDRAVVGRASCQLLRQASTFDQERDAKMLLKHHLHHRAAADVTDTDTENLFHHPMMIRDQARRTEPDGVALPTGSPQSL